MTVDDRYLAVRALHYAGGVPETPPDVVAAQKALSELLDAHRGDMSWSRDTRRAAENFQRKLDAHADSLVALARTKGLLPTTKEHR